TGSAEKNAEVIDEFKEIARETFDRIIGIIENDSSIVDLNDSSSELITEAEISRLIKEYIELSNPVDFNKKEFEKSPITNNTCTIGLRSNKNIVHFEYIPVKRTVKIKKVNQLNQSELPCEVELFVKPSSIPLSCPIHYLDIIRKCMDLYKKTTGNGVLTLNEDCRGYMPQMVLTPSRHLNLTHYKDLISDEGITTNLTIPTSLKRKISSSNAHTNSVIKLTDLGQYSKSIEEIEQLIQEKNTNKTIRILQIFTHTYSILF
ncbi:protein DDB G0276689-like, partial [Aphis craccivora]